MKRFALHITLTAFAALLCIGCSERKISRQINDKVRIEAIENISGSASGGWVITLRISNQTGYQPTLHAATANIFLDNTATATAATTAPITIPKKATTSVNIPLDISVQQPLKAIALMLRLKDNNFEGVELALDAQIEVMGAQRNITIPKSPVNNILDKLGVK